jgi:hypothetical protein
MERVEVEAYSQAVNAWVIRTPGRQFPAAVIQGDSLFSLYTYAQSLLEGLRAQLGEESELLADAAELRDLLWARLQHYEAVLREGGFDLPYNRTAWPK